MEQKLPFDLAEEVDIWKRTYGKRTISPRGGEYYLIDFKHGERRKLYLILVAHLKSLGAEKGYFSGGPHKDFIVKESIIPKHLTDSRKYANAVNCAMIDLKSAVVEIYGSEADYYKNNGKMRSLPSEPSELEKEVALEHAKTIEQSKLEEQARAIQQISTAIPQGKPSDSPEDILTVYPAVPMKRWSDTEKELIASGKLTGEPIEYEVDPEFMKLFGLNDE